MERLRENTEQVIKLEDLVISDPKIKQARDLAQTAHAGQKRLDNVSDYFTHPEAVARIICEEFGIHDSVMIQSAYLHDVPEDTTVTLKEIETDFGDNVARLVDGMTKIKQDIREDGKPLSKTEKDQLTEIKILKINDLDPRIGILKAADRLHNMRTFDNVPEEKRKSKAKETLIYAKLLESLGIWKVMIELEDLSLKYSKPEVFLKYNKLIDVDKRLNKNFIEYMTSSIKSQIPPDIKTEIGYNISGIKRLIHKMKKTPDIKDINDLISFRVAINEPDEMKAAEKCYRVLLRLQREYLLIEDQKRFDNFYLKTKNNGYSAIQITLNTPYGAVEIAITSKKKEDFNNWGVISLLREGEKDLSEYSRVLVFTPKWEAKFFPRGATAIDFAYSIDRELGARAIAAFVDNTPKPMTHVLQSGEQINIKMGPVRIAPDADWSSDPKYYLPETKEMIDEQKLDKKRYRQIQKGMEIARTVTTRQGIYDLSDLLEYNNFKKRLDYMLLNMGCKKSLDNLYFQLGSGRILPEKLSAQMEEFGLSKKDLNLKTLIVEGPDKKGVLGRIGEIIGEMGGILGRLDKKMRNHMD